MPSEASASFAQFIGPPNDCRSPEDEEPETATAIAGGQIPAVLDGSRNRFVDWCLGRIEAYQRG